MKKVHGGKRKSGRTRKGKEGRVTEGKWQQKKKKEE
jgi:hypothetical protein